MDLENQGRILIIDDLESNRYFFSHHLRSAGYQIIEASTGIEGLSLAKQEPDIILLDINLPDLSGIEVCALLKKDPLLQRIPVIQTSASLTEANDYFKGIEGGADSYLFAPVDPLILLSTIKAWLRVRASDKKLNQNLELLEYEKEIRERFVSALSHDLRTPLTAAYLGAQILTMKLEKESPFQSVAKKIVKNINRVDSMIKDLLDASMIRAGAKLQLKIEPFSLTNFLEEVIQDLETISGDIFILNSPKFEGYWDQQAIRRIIENLTFNAVKYGDKNNKIRINCTINPVDDHVVLEIHNWGEPISEEDQKHLFDPFRQASTATQGTGWGLGLNLVHGLVEAHHGSIGVKSDFQTGTTFTVKIPRDCRRKDLV